MEENDNSFDGGNSLPETSTETVNWFGIRARVEEAFEVVFSFGGLGLTALIALGILPWGVLGIGICATLAFVGITRFIATNSWTANHNFRYKREQYFNNRPEYDHNALTGFKWFIVPFISLVAGVALTLLGMYGILSLSLGLSLGVPLLGTSFVGIINFIVVRKWKALQKPIPLNQKSTDHTWGLCMGISAFIAAVAFSYLSFSGILALSTAIALAAPLCILGVAIGLLTLFAWGVNKYGHQKLKGWLKNGNEVSCVGFGYFFDKDKLEESELIKISEPGQRGENLPEE